MRAIQAVKENKGTAATGGFGLAAAGVAVELFRLYNEATEKAGAVLEVGKAKAKEAGALQQALESCMEIIERCAQ